MTHFCHPFLSTFHYSDLFVEVYRYLSYSIYLIFWSSTVTWLIFFKNPTFASPELRFGITENRRFSGSCTASATVRGPFRYAQEDYLMDYSSERNSSGHN